MKYYVVVEFPGNPDFAGWNPVVLVLVAALLVETVARIGTGPALFFSSPRPGALERFGIGTLLGFGLLGTVFLGLALTGLYYPAAIIGSTLLLFAGSGTARTGMPMILRAIREAGFLGWPGWTVLGLAIIPILPKLFMPETEASSYLYHLGAPWQFLLAHRALIYDVPWLYQMPLPLEMTYALPLGLGDERLAKWEVAACFAAANSLFVGRCRKEGQQALAWLGPFLMLTVGYVAWLLGTSKSDMAAAAFFVAGALATMAGEGGLGVVLLVLCAAAKLTYAPLVLIWIVFLPPDRPSRRAIAVSLAVFLAPWLAKSWLATGNPVFPLASSVFPSPYWGRLNDAAAHYNIGTVLLGIYRMADLPGMWLGQMRQDYLVLLLLLPGLVLLGFNRRAAVTCLMAQFVTFAIRPDARYLLPSAWFLVLLIADETGPREGGLRRAIALILVVYGLGRTGINWINSEADWRNVIHPERTGFIQNREMKEMVIHRMKMAGINRVITIGEPQTYRLPARVVYGGSEGETSPVWKMVKESRDSSELARRFSQTGARWLLYNYVSAEQYALAYRAFPWDGRMVRLYVDFCRSHETMVWRTDSCDFVRGGYCLFAISPSPKRRPAGTLWFAPGMDSYFENPFAVQGSLRRGMVSTAIEKYGMVPELGQASTELGLAYASIGDYANAYRSLKKFADEGMMDSYNLTVYATAAVRTGRLDEAEPALRKALRRYPEQRSFMYTELANVRLARARVEIDRKRAGPAENLISEGEEYIRRTPETGGHAARRDAVLARLLAARGDLCLLEGDRIRAAGYLRRACRINPGDPMTMRWGALAENLERNLSVPR